MHPSFQAFLKAQISEGGIPQENIFAVFAALLEDIYEVHSDGFVANIEDGNFLSEDNGRLLLHASGILSPTFNGFVLDEIEEKSKATPFKINSGMREAFVDGELVSTNMFLASDIPENWAYVPNYSSYELWIGHHDPLSDIFLLGMIMASLILGLDFRKIEDLEKFVNNRDNLFVLRPKLHPSIVKLLVEMTALDRTKRPVDLLDVLILLQNYKDFNPSLTSDLSFSDGFISSDLSDKNQWILQELKSRLFNLSRRNRLLYFKPQLRFLNLTVASVPDEADVNLIQQEDLFIWTDGLQQKINKASKISLNRYLPFQDKSFLIQRLKKIGAEARKDVREFGFHQLKLAIAFLNWSDIDESERIQSPLLLIPVNLVMEKGIPPRFSLDIQADVVEINPILSYALNEKYGIKLPAFLDLSQSSLDDFFIFLQQQAIGKIDGLIFNWSNRPKINLLHKLSSDTIYRYLSRLSQKEVIPKEKIKHKTHYKIDHSLNDNPFLWEMDTCNMVLGNFNYKKMSLVFDYEEIASKNIQNKTFSQLFDEQEQKLDWKDQLPNLVKQDFRILSADSTQRKAINLAVSDDDKSYVIQGPPGTGKSQTITNLIVNLVAHGKKVLFICEKRVALDVVFYKLEQANMGELCCLVHDTKADKKSFIFDLKDVYEDYLKFPMDFKEIERKRSKCIENIQIHWSKVEDFERIMGSVHPDVGIPLFQLYERGVSLQNARVDWLDDVKLPVYREWLDCLPFVLELYQQLDALNYADFYQYPLHFFSDKWFVQKVSSVDIKSDLNLALQLIDQVESLLNKLPPVSRNTVYDLQVLANQSIKMEFMVNNHRLFDLIDPVSELSKLFDLKQVELEAGEQKIDDAKKENRFWKHKFDETFTQEALLFMQVNEGRFFSFLNGRYRKLKTDIEHRYDFEKHAVRPYFVDVLKKLQKEYEIENEIKASKSHFLNQYQVTEDVFQKVLAIRSSFAENSWMHLVRQEPDKLIVIQKLYQLLDELESIFSSIYDEIYKKTLSEAKSEITQLLQAISAIDLLLPSLKNIYQNAPKLMDVLKKHSVSIHQLEFHIIKNTIQNFYQSNPNFKKKTGLQIQNHIHKTADLYHQLMQLNAAYVRSEYRSRFNRKIWVTEQSASVLSPSEKDLKKVYRRGRRILENEFSKKMRYKSIRTLTGLESKEIIFDLKPVWLMSPLSVSDVVPLDTENFDVVIFDEASQITIEEGIPALFRAKKAIIVGDEMQMPPTNFFSTKSNDEEEMEDGVYLDVDSLLTQAARKLSAVRLGWHYRSRHEALINFSNAAFYQRSLMTVPDVQTLQDDLVEIVVDYSDQVNISLQKMLQRPISYHYLENGIYTDRSNPSEAEYIAHLVRKLLFDDHHLSIGIVAFSQKQQSEIDQALQQLASVDEHFDTLLEAEYMRHEDGQFTGLFIKNLENVQGDERDLMILSICYGKNTQGKMRMNFGPINREGGEKRLNVIFSRAKKHMAVITSIHAHQITNDYNPGANYFKQFLKYAHEISTGNQKMAQETLNKLSKLSISESTVIHAVAKSMKSYFEAKGLIVMLNVGQSDFVCHLAVKRKSTDSHYLFGILLDDKNHYDQANSLTQYLQKPLLLETFGWTIYHICVKDWWERREDVLGLMDSYF